MPNEGTETAAGERTRATSGIPTPGFLRREEISFIWHARRWWWHRWRGRYPAARYTRVISMRSNRKAMDLLEVRDVRVARTRADIVFGPGERAMGENP